MFARVSICALLLLCVALVGLAMTGCDCRCHDSCPGADRVRPSGEWIPDGSTDPNLHGRLAPHNPHAVINGKLTCQRCGRDMVGADIATFWVNDSTPASFLCQACNAAMSPHQRTQAYNTWLQRQPFGTRGALEAGALSE